MKEVMPFTFQFAHQHRFEHLVLLELLPTRVHDFKIMIQLSVLRHRDAKNNHLLKKVVGEGFQIQSFGSKHRLQMLFKQTIYAHNVLRRRMLRKLSIHKHHERLIGFFSMVIRQIGLFKPASLLLLLQ